MKVKDVLKTGFGSPLVLIHGALSDLNVWHAHLDRLSERFEVITLTLPGFETSETNSAINIDEHAKVVIDFIKQSGMQSVKLTGWSYGADVALASVLIEPRLFEGVLLYEPGYPGALDNHSLHEYFDDAMQVFSKVQNLVEQDLLEDAIKALIDGTAGLDGYFYQQPKRYQQQQLSKHHTLKRQLNQIPSTIINREHLVATQAKIKVGYGENTRPIFKLVSNVTAQLTGTQAKCLPGEHHFWPLESPDAFCEWIEVFFSNMNHSSNKV